jgi:hypothetical protein
MSPFTRFMSWMTAVGGLGATSNARRALEERTAAHAEIDALSDRLAATPAAPARPPASPPRAA